MGQRVRILASDALNGFLLESALAAQRVRFTLSTEVCSMRQAAAAQLKSLASTRAWWLQDLKHLLATVTRRVKRWTPGSFLRF